MPATPFNPLAAIIVHSQVPVNVLTFQLMDAEEALLIHRCTRSASREEWIRWNKAGKMIVFVRHSPRLLYSVQATALDPTGENLGNYHPGRCLSDRALAFVNGERNPFQFGTDGVGKLILKEPSQDPGPGDATEVAFTVEHAFVDLDVPAFPGGGTATPGEPTLFVEIPAQSDAVLTAAACTAILQAVFHGADPFDFDNEALTLTLYNGVPGGGGVAISDPLELSPWTTLTEPSAGTTRAANHAILTFLDASHADRTITHVVWRRNNIIVSSKALATPLIIPAYYGVKVPVGNLALKLTWNWTGASTARPATVALNYLMGDPSTGVTPDETTLTINCYDADPNTTGLLLDSFTVPRDNTTWILSAANTIENDIVLEGTDTAPPGDWTILYITVELAGVATLLYSHNVSGSLVIDEGDPVSIPPGGIAQTIS